MTITYEALGSEGRLGNQLWQIASTLGIAHSLGEEVSFPKWEYQRWFSVPEELFRGAQGTDSIQLAVDIPEAHRPYLQNLNLWWDIRDLIISYFQPSAEAIEILKTMGWYGRADLDRTAIHVRRTDAVAKQAWFKVPDMNYFSPAMKIVAEENPDTNFLVFSDDIRWCWQNFPANIEFISDVLPEPGRNYRGDPLGNQNDWKEFFLQADCQHHITSNSTFSWWAAMISHDSTPITPAVWYGRNYINEINLDWFIPEHWRRL